MADRNHLERLTKDLTDSGKLIEAGWVGMRLACNLIDAPPDQLREMRMAFFAGAQHLLASIMTFLDPGDEPTDADLRRMELISAELQGFIDDFVAKHVSTQGEA